MAFDNTNYKRVEYLQASSTSGTAGPYIDLNLSGSYYRFVAKGFYTATKSWQQYLYGYQQSYAEDDIRQNSNATSIRGAVRGQSATISSVALNTDHIFELCSDPDNAYFTIDGDTRTMSVGQTFTAGARYLFACYSYSASGVAGCSNALLYYCKIYDLNGDLVRDLVPCQQRNSPNKYGMYDTIGEQFYGTQNGYDFTGGPEVVSGCATYVKIGGTWKEADAVYVKVGGIWTQGDMNVKISGTWKDS